MTPPLMTSPGRGRLALLTGGAGFVATNVADRLLRHGWRVRLFDNLSRAGVDGNILWLYARHGARMELHFGDIRDAAAVAAAVRNVDQVFHFAAQVAVTTSLVDPIADFEINARGTLNLLEALRTLTRPPSVVFTSTNKVYGTLEDVPLRVEQQRYTPVDPELARHGIPEWRPLDFHSPYGCSKGAADQYVLDYARTWRLPAVVFRMSCIYGAHQLGTEDQGWVAHFARQALQDRPITVFGDGCQVRDLLFADDLTDALLLAHETVERTAGQVFNIGGGPGNAVSLRQVLDLLQERTGRPLDVHHEPWRPADQRFYVSNIRRFSLLTGWQPSTTVRAGIARLLMWLQTGVAGEPARGRTTVAS